MSNVIIDITPKPKENIVVDSFVSNNNITVNASPIASLWGNILGTLSAQSDLWNNLSEKALKNEIIPTVENYLATNKVEVNSIDAKFEILSGGVNLFDIFLTSDTDAQTLTYNIENQALSISNGNTISLSSLSYRNITPVSSYKTIQEFANNFANTIYAGNTVELYNGKIYTFAGYDKNDPAHYLEINSNPLKPIYKEISLSGSNKGFIDSFFLGDFKSAKYNLQIETNFNNEIYYSEINVVGSVGNNIGVACEYGQLFTSQLILGYSVDISVNTLNFYVNFEENLSPDKKLIIKGCRTNFYKV